MDDLTKLLVSQLPGGGIRSPLNNMRRPAWNPGKSFTGDLRVDMSPKPRAAPMPRALPLDPLIRGYNYNDTPPQRAPGPMSLQQLLQRPLNLPSSNPLGEEIAHDMTTTDMPFPDQRVYLPSESFPGRAQVAPQRIDSKAQNVLMNLLNRRPRSI